MRQDPAESLRPGVVRRRFATLALIGLMLAASGPVTAEPASGEDHSQHGAAVPAGADTPATRDFEAAAQKMHKQMSLPYTGDVDIDFVRGMIPHHQGAIEQAEILLKYSKNPRLRRLAGGIIAAQKREIRFMEKWLKENAEGVDTGEMPAWLKSNPNTIEDAEKAGAPDKD